MLTFNECENLMARGRNGMKKLGNNTYLEEIVPGTFGVRLHGTYVVRIHRDGTYTLNSGGWRTVTTKQRINEYSPAKLFQEKHVWYVSADGRDVEFHDGFRVDANGQPITGIAA